MGRISCERGVQVSAVEPFVYLAPGQAEFDLDRYKVVHQKVHDTVAPAAPVHNRAEVAELAEVLMHDVRLMYSAARDTIENRSISQSSPAERPEALAPDA